MEEDVLLDMYRNTWDAFLEAYKEKMDQVDELTKIAKHAVELYESEGYDKAAKETKEKIKEILEV